MTQTPSAVQLTFERVPVESIGRAQWREIIDLCSVAYDEDFAALFRTLPDTTHILARQGNRLVSHACWVVRWLQPGDLRPLRTAYLEAVATAPEYQGLGFGSAVMRRAAAEITDFELGGLSPGRYSFYERLGWEPWRGPLAIRTDDGLLITPRDNAMVLRLPCTPELDLDAPMTAEWRVGELW
jgi:aminoglycoside 2'-N-acetyltransferase I